MMRATYIGLAMLVIPLWSAVSQTPAVLIPGLSETNDFTNPWAYYLNATGNYAAQTVPTLNTSSSVGTQSSSVSGYLSGIGGTNAILIGHSMGGVVSRYTARSTPVLGLLTVATPNFGANVADPLTMTTIVGQEAMAGIFLFDMNQVNSTHFQSCDGCGEIWYEATTGVTDVVALLGAGFELYNAIPFLFGNPYTADLKPSSPWISGLIENPGLEQATFRQAIAVDVQDYAAAPFRLAYTAATADYYASYLAYYGMYLMLQGGYLVTIASDPSRCWDEYNCGVIIGGGQAMGNLGQLIEDVPWVANYAIIGGIPNDALVPTYAESLPDKQIFRIVTGLNHNEILGNAADVVAGADAVSGR